jgi:thymidylate synthase (FAD)
MMTVKWKKYYPLTDKNAFICLADNMGTDTTIAERARTSYNRDGKSMLQLKRRLWAERLQLPILEYDRLNPGSEDIIITLDGGERILYKETSKDRIFWDEIAPKLSKAYEDDRGLIRRLMRDGHTSPFEMCELVFLVQTPMDCWRQWVRHRTASINEYSTRYTEALDFFQVTDPAEWRLQATDNKQGSSGFLQPKDWPEDFDYEEYNNQPFSDAGNYLTNEEYTFHKQAQQIYKERLRFGIAKEQARKDLPLSTYTRAYWKCDLHNIFNFLRLRMDSHAQLEIRSFANCMFEIVQQVCPVACEAFEDYVLHAKRFSRMEMEVIRELFVRYTDSVPDFSEYDKPSSMTDREWKEFVGKLS